MGARLYDQNNAENLSSNSFAIWLHIINFANVKLLLKGMKVCVATKTIRVALLSAIVALLTIFSIPGSVSAQSSYKVRKVVLDPGHGGKDPGCNGKHSKEKEIALSIALELGKMIKASHPDIQVIYTRDKDVFIPLNERAAIANRNKADLFISIHCNYIGIRNRASGSETYVLGLHRAEDNLDVAKRENASILLEEDYEKTYEGFDPYSPEGHIILSMFQHAHLEQSIQLATHIENSFKKNGKIPSRGVKQAGFLVLRETTMPSVLVETGFLSTDLDENYLMQKENQKEVAAAMLRAFNQYKKDYERGALPDSPDSHTVSPKDNKAPAPEKEVKSTASSGQTVEKAVQKTDASILHEVIYRIQVAASPKSNVEARLNSLEDLEVIKEGTMYKFVVGRFLNVESAKQRLSELRQTGFQDAFIVSYKNGERIRA